jgi:RimJ/RimL family protein N-acetyltransferase
MHADPEVMHDHRAVLPPAEGAAKFRRYRQSIDEYGFGRWAVELRSSGQVIGYTGVQPILSNLPLAPGFEIGWRLCRQAWGHGYASEAAQRALEDVFSRCGLAEVLSFTGLTNVRSEAVMRRIGMFRCEDLDFVHPDNFTGLCVVYRARPVDQHAASRRRRQD